jgi:diaminohydroxyphosphoribosylaminopyrimidine deaminase/5-amino-6-(5-phosphoribosylamino)uracil reductase
MRPEEAMRRALVRARQAEGRVHPNPAVGAVVVRGARVLGAGSTQAAGGPHAEVKALGAAIRRHGAAAVRGATLAVTLEPCNHTGQTPPCTQAILEAGVRRVWIGARDPHPLVRGRGIRRLRRAGVDVVDRVLEAECREHHRGFFSVHEHGRPWLALKLAATLDGRLATASGESRWITGPRARERVHALRERVDAVLVGSLTAVRDDPELTARRGKSVRHRPVRVVVDSRLSLPRGARMLQGPDPERTWLLASRTAPVRRRRALEAAGARVFPIRRRGAHLDLRAALEKLATEGITTVLVEGGGVLGAALLRAGLVDELHWFAAPTWLGADAKPALGDLGIARLAERLQLEAPVVSRVGGDLYIRGRVLRSRARGRSRS